MQQTRRSWLETSLAAVAGVAAAGCSDPGTEVGNEQDAENEPSADDEGTEPQLEADAVDLGVVSEWNALRTRLRDPVVLGHAGAYAAGATVAADVFRRFEAASGEHSAHETLEETSEESYEGFEDALGDLRERLAAEDLDGAHEAMRTADGHLREAQATLTDERTVRRLSMLVMGTHVEDAALLLEVDDHDDAEHEFSKIGEKFEAKHYDTVAGADAEAADRFVAATGRAAESAASAPADATAAAHEAFTAATQGLYALVDDSLAGACHLAALQARGWDGTTLAALVGPSRSYAHAAALNDYRARARDVAWMYDEGSEATAGAFVRRALERFETARVHDALEEANREAYESFEGGLESLGTAIEDGDDDAVREAVGTIEASVRDGIGALAAGDQPALLEAGYAKARIEDAAERYRRGDVDGALGIARGVLSDFEADASGFHESVEETDDALYEAFEHEHLEGLIEALEADDAEAVATHVEGVRETLLSYETAVGPRSAVSGVESGYVSARLRDAVVLDELGVTDRSRTVATEAFQYFEAGAGGFHEALESADHGTYEAFEAAVTALQDGLGEGETTGELAAVVDRAVDATYAVVAAGSGGSDPASVVRDVLAHFEEAPVHDALEAADGESYESFEAALEAYVEALESGSAGDAAAGFADASLRAQFAVAGAPDEAPIAADGGAGDGEDGGDESLEGGPNVVEGVPDDADHVVDMNAVAFEPAELTVARGDTVAWTHAGGEPHSVSADDDGVPDDADYWASGGFDSETAARDGWENGRGAVQPGQSYVRTFGTTGTHEYLCIPHEAAGMVGTVTVE